MTLLECLGKIARANLL